MQDFLADFSMLLLGVISALLILVVLLQRGRGGGLAGAFGGLGGQSAFGTKAGDVFTKITIGLVTAWVLLAGVSGVLARKASEKGDFSDTTTETEDDSENAGGSMSAVGDATSEDEGAAASDDTTGDDASGDSGIPRRIGCNLARACIGCTIHHAAGKLIAPHPSNRECAATATGIERIVLTELSR